MVNLVRRQFVAVALDGRMAMDPDNAEGKFIREDCGIRLPGAGGKLVAVTAAGDVLDNKYHPDVHRAYNSWLRLPKHMRRPGVVKVPLLDFSEKPLTGPKGQLIKRPPPPKEGLILKLNLRALTRDDMGLRHLRRTDIPSRHRLTRIQIYYDANPDYLWLKKDEWQTLVPQDPTVGQTFPVDNVVAERIFRFHLDPQLVFGETEGLRTEQIRQGQLSLTVTSVSEESIHMQLQGSALLGSDFATADAAAKQTRASAGYEPQLLGYLEFNRRQNAFTRFDMVALGDTYGQLRGDLKHFYRLGRHPLGVTFELVAPGAPIADLTVPPRGMRFPHNYYSTGL